MGLTFNRPSLFLTAHCLTWRFRQPLSFSYSCFAILPLACSIDYLSPSIFIYLRWTFVFHPFPYAFPFQAILPRAPSLLARTFPQPYQTVGSEGTEPPINQTGANTALSHSSYYIYLLYRLLLLCLVRDCSLWLCFPAYLFLAVVPLSLFDWAVTTDTATSPLFANFIFLSLLE